MAIEFGILDWIQSRRTPFLDSFMVLVTRLGDGGTILIVMAALLMAFPQTRKEGAAVAVALLIETVVCNIVLKPMVGRIRPCDIANVELLIPRPTDFSFPSGHAGASFAAAIALMFCASRLSTPGMALAALISVSRLYLYVHFPSDVVAGAMVGFASAWAGTKLVQFGWPSK